MAAIYVDKQVHDLIISRVLTVDRVLREAIGLRQMPLPRSWWTTERSHYMMSVADDVYSALRRLKEEKGFDSINDAVRYTLGLPPHEPAYKYR